LNKGLENKAKELNCWLLEQDVVKEYLKYEKLIHQHVELSREEEELKAMQKKIVNDKHLDKDCDELIKEYEERKEKFYGHPIVHNYILLKEEVNQLTWQINTLINEEVNHIKK
jgi:Predicted membrane protein